VEKDCAAGGICADGRCAEAGASFVRKEILGEDGRVSHPPLLHRDGSPILDEKDLAAAVASGEIVLYQGRQEIAVVQKPDSAWARFSTTGGRRTAQGVFLATDTQSCREIGGPVTDRLVRLETAAGAGAALVGRTFRITYDYFDGCTDCWGAGPCFRIEPDAAGKGFPSDEVKGWQWSLFDYRIVYGKSSAPGEIGIHPVTGEITGLPGARISYYHGGKP